MPVQIAPVESFQINMLSELNIYNKILSDAAVISSGRVFTNSGKEHAAIAMSVMYRNTRQKIKLIADNFNGSVSNNDRYALELANCLSRGVKAEIIILDPQNLNYDSKGFKLYHNFSLQNPSQVKIKTANDETKRVIKESNTISNKEIDEIYNVGLFDNDKYRFELVPSKYIALLSFNNSELVSKYQKVFDIAFETASVLA